jgi:hypothetical protein
MEQEREMWEMSEGSKFEPQKDSECVPSFFDFLMINLAPELPCTVRTRYKNVKNKKHQLDKTQ